MWKLHQKLCNSKKGVGPSCTWSNEAWYIVSNFIMPGPGLDKLFSTGPRILIPLLLPTTKHVQLPGPNILSLCKLRIAGSLYPLNTKSSLISKPIHTFTKCRKTWYGSKFYIQADIHWTYYFSLFSMNAQSSLCITNLRGPNCLVWILKLTLCCKFGI